MNVTEMLIRHLREVAEFHEREAARHRAALERAVRGSEPMPQKKAAKPSKRAATASASNTAKEAAPARATSSRKGAKTGGRYSPSSVYAAIMALAPNGEPVVQVRDLRDRLGCGSVDPRAVYRHIRQSLVALEGQGKAHRHGKRWGPVLP